MFSSDSFFTEDLHKFRSYKAFSKYTKYNVLFFCLSKIVFRWAAQIAHQGQLAHHIGKRQVSGVVTPGNIPGLVPGSAAAAQWWDFLKFWQELFTLQCTRITFFSHPNITVCQQSPRITTLVIVSLQLPTLTNREINATQNSFSESAGFHFPRPCWICVCSVPKTHHTHRWAAQIAHQGQLAHHIGKRQVSGVVTPGNIPGLVPGSAAAAQWWDFLNSSDVTTS